MNLNDFVVVPNNTAKSVKLNARNLQELKMETVVLAQESTEMEDKLQQLKERMSKEKKERPPPPPLAPTKGMGIRTVPTRKNRLKGPTCGQCDVKAAGIMCAECSEDYCICCFAKFHQRGALKFHRIIPIQVSMIPRALSLPPLPLLLSVPKSKRASRFFHKENRSVEVVDEEQKGEKEQLPASLLSGLYDEEESARSFQEALRQGGREEREPVRVEFMEYTLTYMDRLLLKKHRRYTVNTMCGPHTHRIYTVYVRYVKAPVRE
uniref:B box-type domain-containing protein n=1 Tax=Sphaeramia orbicularis TaxID=375764 RepID=A0A672YP72_9TELE